MAKTGLRTGTIVAALISAAASAAASEVAFPEGFRSWTHVKAAVVTDTPQTAAFSGLHNIYANAPAMAGYRSGVFPDGSVIVFDNFEVETAGNALRPGRRRSTDVMLRDRSDPSGWRFESFAGGNPGQRADAGTKAACQACHLRESAGDGVFSDFCD